MVWDIMGFSGRNWSIISLFGMWIISAIVFLISMFLTFFTDKNSKWDDPVSSICFIGYCIMISIIVVISAEAPRKIIRELEVRKIETKSAIEPYAVWIDKTIEVSKKRFLLAERMISDNADWETRHGGCREICQKELEEKASFNTKSANLEKKLLSFKEEIQKVFEDFDEVALKPSFNDLSQFDAFEKKQIILVNTVNNIVGSLQSETAGIPSPMDFLKLSDRKRIDSNYETRDVPKEVIKADISFLKKPGKLFIATGISKNFDPIEVLFSGIKDKNIMFFFVPFIFLMIVYFVTKKKFKSIQEKEKERMLEETNDTAPKRFIAQVSKSMGVHKKVDIRESFEEFRDVVRKYHQNEYDLIVTKDMDKEFAEKLRFYAEEISAHSKKISSIYYFTINKEKATITYSADRLFYALIDKDLFKKFFCADDIESLRKSKKEKSFDGKEIAEQIFELPLKSNAELNAGIFEKYEDAIKNLGDSYYKSNPEIPLILYIQAAKFFSHSAHDLTSDYINKAEKYIAKIDNPKSIEKRIREFNLIRANYFTDKLDFKKAIEILRPQVDSFLDDNQHDDINIKSSSVLGHTYLVNCESSKAEKYCYKAFEAFPEYEKLQPGIHLLTALTRNRKFKEALDLESNLSKLLQKEGSDFLRLEDSIVFLNLARAELGYSFVCEGDLENGEKILNKIYPLPKSENLKKWSGKALHSCFFSAKLILNNGEKVSSYSKIKSLAAVLCKDLDSKREITIITLIDFSLLCSTDYIIRKYNPNKVEMLGSIQATFNYLKLHKNPQDNKIKKIIDDAIKERAKILTGKVSSRMDSSALKKYKKFITEEVLAKCGYVQQVLP